MSRAYIDDGYTIDDTIPELPGHYPAVKFSYRPATYRELRRIDAAISAPATMEQAIDATCQFVADHVVAWDVIDSKGEAVPVTSKAMDRLESVLLAELFNRTRGIYPAGVPVPEAAQETAPGN